MIFLEDLFSAFCRIGGGLISQVFSSLTHHHGGVHFVNGFVLRLLLSMKSRVLATN